MALLTLFITALLSATLLPGGSEALVLLDVKQGLPWAAVWLSATAGNTAGSMINYGIGRQGEHYLETKGYASAKAIASARRYVNRWGGWALLLSWMPIIGDPITLLAGALRYDFKRFVVLVIIAKGLRYALVIVGYFHTNMTAVFYNT